MTQLVKHLTSVQVITLESGDGGPHQAPYSAGSLLLSPSAPPPLMLPSFLSIAHSKINKKNPKKKKVKQN